MNVDKVFLGLGSNLGDRLAHLSRAVDAIESIRDTALRAQSSVYETQPRFYTAQPNFLNACVQIQTKLSALELLNALQTIEDQLGRARSIPNGPRTIDLDILLYGEHILNEPNLLVPHPGLHERTFVLVPLAEIMRQTAPEMLHPRFKRSIPALLADAPDIGWVRKFDAQTRLSKKLSPTSH